MMIAKRKPSRPNLKAAFKYLSVASLLTAAASARAQSYAPRPFPEFGEESFNTFLTRVSSVKDTSMKRLIVDNYVAKIHDRGAPPVEDSTVYFIYRGKTRRVTVPSDLNGWDPSADTMSRVRGTDLFVLSKRINRAARFEYKFVVDTAWILDPLNRHTAMGGYGPNSELCMPDYAPPGEIAFRENIPHGTVDTLTLTSKLLGRTHPVFVYRPAGFDRERGDYPSIIVTDGGEYISLALMLNVLDNMIADSVIEPVIAIFVDPRTDVTDSRTSHRMEYYTMSDTFVQSLVHELRPRIKRKYGISDSPSRSAIMGASLGGVISLYAAHSRPDVFGMAASQSPAFWLNDEALIRLVQRSPRKPLRLYIDTGTIRDAEVHARKMKSVLEERGYEFSYAEYHEGHNWVNWRARVDDILKYFFGRN